MHPHGVRNVLLAFTSGIVSAAFVLPLQTDSLIRLILLGLAPLPLFMGGLSSGTLTCLAGGLTGAVVVLAVMGSFFGGFYMAAICIPTAILVWQALRSPKGDNSNTPDGNWYKGGNLLLWLAGLGIVGLLGSIGYLTLFQGGLTGMIGKRLDMAPVAAAMAARIVPGLVTALWMVVIAACGIVAEWLVVKFGWAIRPPVDANGLRLPLWIGPVLMVAGLAGAVVRFGPAGIICLNAAIVLIVPFAFLGLAIIHAQAGKRRDGVVWMTVFYMVLLGSPALLGWQALLIFVLMLAGLGSADQLLDLRNLRGLRSEKRRK